jgi:RNA polymerase sigma-70 factor (ECF subfamily)
MEIGLQKNVRPRQASVDLDRRIEYYQQADSVPAHAFVATLSPDLLRFFRNQVASRQQAADPLREPWMRNHRVRHTYRPGEPVRPWVYAIARWVEGYPPRRRIETNEIAIEVLPERPARAER